MADMLLGLLNFVQLGLASFCCYMLCKIILELIKKFQSDVLDKKIDLIHERWIDFGEVPERLRAAKDDLGKFTKVYLEELRGELRKPFCQLRQEAAVLRAKRSEKKNTHHRQ